MISVPDFGLFKDAKGRRCIAYNCNLPHCLIVGDDGSQTFTLAAGDTNSARIDAGQHKVRTMAAPNDRNAGGAGLLPQGQFVRFKGTVLINKTKVLMDRWWFLFAQIQRIPDAGDINTSPPVALQILNDKGTETFHVALTREGGPAGGTILPNLMDVPVPRGKKFIFQIDYFDAKGKTGGKLIVRINVDGAWHTIINYRGITGFDDKAGIYPAWGIYAADGWKQDQLPLTFRFTELEWGISPMS